MIVVSQWGAVREALILLLFGLHRLLGGGK